MSEGWLGLGGRIADGAHLFPVRVYYEDTDFSGAVYHANFLKYCERARSECLRLLGIHHRAHRDQAEARTAFVVRRMSCEFHKPARIDDLLEVETRVLEVSGARMELDQRAMRSGEVLFEARVTVASVDGGGRPKRLPKEIATAMCSLLVT
jgi:acyl-CoA thioester hydrolase